MYILNLSIDTLYELHVYVPCMSVYIIVPRERDREKEREGERGREKPQKDSGCAAKTLRARIRIGRWLNFEATRHG